MEIFASPFFNAAIGQLLRDLSSDQRTYLLRIQNLDPDRLRVLRRVIQNSKRYYADEAERRAVDDVLAEEARRS